MPTINIKSPQQLSEALLNKEITLALSNTQQEIFDAIQESIDTYYQEYTPEFYDRKFKFMNSLVKTNLKKTGNVIQCEVKIDDSYLNYSYPNLGTISSTGLDVVRWANREIPGYGNHGATVDAGRNYGFWDVGVRDIGGDTGVIALLKTNLRKRGICVR